METMRERAKEHLPHVLLTLLSIMQALALELLWDRVTSEDYLFHPSLQSALYLGQMLTTFLGIRPRSQAGEARTHHHERA